MVSGLQVIIIGVFWMDLQNRIEIRNQIIQEMMAAQNTTAVLISNTFFLLSRSPAIWERLRDETASVSH